MMSRVTCVAFFGGQGNSKLFSGETAAAALEKAKSSSAAALLISRCHSAFLDELLSARTAESPLVLDELMQVVMPEDLLNPKAAHDNPIIQGLTLCLHQLLEYLTYSLPQNSTLESALVQHTNEAVGFCSGILPAIVASSAKTVWEFISYSVQIFRLAFWLGYRVGEYCEEQLGHGWREQGPWATALIARDIDVEMLQKRVAFFNAEHSSLPAYEICISSVNSASSVSIAGAGPALQKFQTSIKNAGSFERVPIYGLYHGGHHALPILRRVLDDCSRCKISIPSFAGLRTPLRSSISGSFVAPGEGKEDMELVEVALRSILIDSVDWQSTWKKITQMSSELDSRVEVLVVGPVSRSLLPLPCSTDASSRDNVRILNASRNDPQERDSVDPSWDSDSVAIVGMSVNFPIGSTKDAFWAAIKDGQSAVQEIPISRFDISSYSGKLGSQAIRYGNFLASPWEFDHDHFNVSPREAKSMDPQQRLLLHAAVHALDDAGYTPDSTPSFQRNSMGCYIGAATEDYIDNLRSDIDVYYSTGTLRAFLSGKISYAFNLSGPSVVIDTACSSSMVAIYQACRALKNRDCSSAIAGGVNSMTSPDMYLGLSRAHFLSSTGQCKTFDAAADGYCRAEGCGLFVLKRLRDAISENDRIYGVIRGIEVNQCGNSHSITHPHRETQQALFRQLLSKAAVDPSSVNVVEAHGTGTQAGDTTEIASLQHVFGGPGQSSAPLFVTSVKSNTGHAEAASGAAGLAKLLLMLRQQQIPPQAGLQILNPRVASSTQYNLTIPTEMQPWPMIGCAPRRALLNNFGAAGSNAALILEEYNEEPKEDTPQRSAYIFIISAGTDVGLERLRKRYIDWLLENPDADIRNICYTATARRQRYDYLISIVCKSSQDLCAKLNQLQKPTRTKSGIKSFAAPMIFVFSGQGASYHGMGKELLITSPIFRNSVLECDQHLQRMGFPTVLPMIEGSQELSAQPEGEQTIISQSACFTIEYALAKLWQSWNVMPDLVIGHSLGEYAAMVQAEVISLEDALSVVANRAMLMTRHCAPRTTSMLACNIQTQDASIAMELKQGKFEGLSVACFNSLNDYVISGPIDQIEAFSSHCVSRGWKCKKLDVPYGFHSTAMDPILEALTQICSTVKLSPPKIPIGPNYLGRLLKPEDLLPQYFSLQTRNTVQFSGMIQSLPSEIINSATFLEIGPATSTLPMVKNTLPDRDLTCLGSLTPKQSPWTTLSTSLAQTDRNQEGINWRHYFDGSSAKLIDAPEYPLESPEQFVPFKESSKKTVGESTAMADTPPYPLGLRELPSTSTQETKVYETDLASLSKYVKGHVVGGTGLCPASVYYELVLEAGTRAVHSSCKDVLVVRDIIFDTPLVYDAARDADKIRLFLSMDKSVTSSKFIPSHFKIVSWKSDTSAEGKTHCKGTLETWAASSLRNKFARTADIIRRLNSHRERSQGAAFNTFTTRMLYDTIFPRVVEYSKSYQAITRLTVLENGSEGFGFFKIPPDAASDECILSPTFVDTLLHGAGFIANSHVTAKEACICIQVESIKALYESVDEQQTFSIYCSLFDHIEGMTLADAYAMTDDGTVIAAVEGMHFKKIQLKPFQAHLARHISKSKPTSKPTELVMPSQSSRKASHNYPPSQLEHVKQGGRTNQEEIDAKAIVLELVANVCEIPRNTLCLETTLSNLGIDSLLLIELSDAMKARFPQLNIDHSAMVPSSTVKDLQDHVLSGSPAETLRDSVARNRRLSISRPRLSRQCSSMQKIPITLETGSANIVFQSEDLRAASQMPILGYSPPDSPVTKVKAVVQAVCEVAESDLRPDTTLESLGVDSLLSIELRNAFMDELGADIPVDALSGPVTLESLGKLAGGQNSLQSGPEAYNGVNGTPFAHTRRTIPIAVQSGPGTINPLYLFHDGSGTIGMYSNLKSLDRQVFGFDNSGSVNGHHWASTLTEMAAHYSSTISARSHQSVILGGWSFGGVLAYEVARQLLRIKFDVKGVIIIDSPCPVNHQPLPEPVIQHIVKPIMETRTPAGQKSAAALASQFRTHAELLSQYRAEPTTSEDGLRCVMLRSQDTMGTTTLCGVSYPWLEDQDARSQSIKDWERLVGHPMEVLPIPGNHFEPFTSPHVDSVSDRLKEACDIICGS